MRMSGVRAWTRRDLRMPALHVRAFLWHSEIGALHEIDCDQAGDIGNAVAVPGDERHVLYFAVENTETLRDARLVGLGPSRDLRHLQLLHGGVGVPKHMHYGIEEIELKPAVPHFDLRNLPGPAP